MTAMKKTRAKAVKKIVKEPNAPVPNIKELLLNGPKFDFKLPKRTKWRSRPPVKFD